MNTYPPRWIDPALPASNLRSGHGTHINKADRFLSVFLLTFLSCAIVLVSLAFLSGLLHWFIVPVTACGVLIGIEAMDWLRGKTDLFDVGGLVSLLGYHFFFVAPILMIVFDWRMKFLPDQPADYRGWLGMMACVNVMGLLVYRSVLYLTRARRIRTAAPKMNQRRWEIVPDRFWVVLGGFTLTGIGCQAYIFLSLGGIGGYINSYTAALGGQDSFQGASGLYLIAESTPVLIAIGIAVWASRNNRSWALIASAIVILGVLEFLVGGGLRGSRSGVIWSLFWIVGIMHIYVRRLPRTVAYSGILVAYLFVSLYAAYKQKGADLFNAFESSGDYSALNDKAEGPATVLVGDFSRADVQSFLMYKLWNESAPLPAFGQTYLGAAAMLVPKSLWPDRPPTILKWTTDAEYGANAYESGQMKSSRVYGITGEAMLNFGIPGALPAFAIFALLVAALRSFTRNLSAGDSRWLFVPFLLNSLFVLLLNDSDNTLFYLIKTGLLPVLLIVTCSRRRLVTPVCMRVQARRTLAARQVTA